MRKIYRGLLISVMVMLLMVMVAVPVSAFDVRAGDTVTVPNGEVVEGDLYLTGGSIIINGTVKGDIFGAGRALTVNGVVEGGVTFAGQIITLNGPVSHGVRVAGQSIVLNGDVGRDLVVAGADVTISGNSRVSGDLILAVGTAQVDGPINGNIKGGASSVTISSKVNGNVELNVDNLTVTSAASIEGNLTYTSRNQANLQSGARIAGTITRKAPETPEPARGFGPVIGGIAVVGEILGYLMILVVGIIIILLASRRVKLMADSVQSHPWQSLGWGAVILIVTPIAAIIVMLTIIGLPVGLMALVLYGIAIYLSQLPVALLIGRLIIRQNRELESQGLMIGALALGLFILLILRLIPFIGWIVALLTIVFGLGTLVTLRRKEVKV